MSNQDNTIKEENTNDSIENKEQDVVKEAQAEENTDATEDVKEELSVEEKLQKEVQAEKDKFLRLFAEFENYKKRTSKERLELFKTASKDVMVAMLPILDDFDRAYVEISKSEDKELLKGVELISNKLKTTLQGKGLEQM